MTSTEPLSLPELASVSFMLILLAVLVIVVPAVPTPTVTLNEKLVVPEPGRVGIVQVRVSTPAGVVNTKLGPEADPPTKAREAGRASSITTFVTPCELKLLTVIVYVISCPSIGALSSTVLETLTSRP